ncbi:MAG: DUF1415 domain-containing protein [Tatlockia sp.]|jgi:hypothetical protein
MSKELPLCIQQTKQWIELFIIKLNLCPFAKYEVEKNEVMIQQSVAKTTEEALDCLHEEIKRLDDNPTAATSFLLFPFFLHNFLDYLDFVKLAELELGMNGYKGIYQLATFHPDYCFAATQFDDITNYSNRSPYPMLHILREESVEKAISHYPDTKVIPENNIRNLQALGKEGVENILAECLVIK